MSSRAHTSFFCMFFLLSGTPVPDKRKKSCQEGFTDTSTLRRFATKKCQLLTSWQVFVRSRTRSPPRWRQPLPVALVVPPHRTYGTLTLFLGLRTTSPLSRHVDGDHKTFGTGTLMETTRLSGVFALFDHSCLSAPLATFSAPRYLSLPSVPLSTSRASRYRTSRHPQRLSLPLSTSRASQHLSFFSLPLSTSRHPQCLSAPLATLSTSCASRYLSAPLATLSTSEYLSVPCSDTILYGRGGFYTAFKCDTMPTLESYLQYNKW
jgi:hypothetical protein